MRLCSSLACDLAERIKELLEELDAQCNKHRAEQDDATLQQYKIALHEENAR